MEQLGLNSRAIVKQGLRHTFRRKYFEQERRELFKQLGVKKITSHHQKTKLLKLRKRRAGHARTLGSYPSTLGEIDPLGFAKLGWRIGTRRLWGKLPPQSSLTLVRFFGLSIAARIVNLKVVRRAKNPHA
jgi:hypothetical protein